MCEVVCGNNVVYSTVCSLRSFVTVMHLTAILVFLCVKQLGLPSGIRVIFYYPILRGYLK